VSSPWESGRAEINPERCQPTKDVPNEALRLAPEERAAFLDRACGTDHSLRQEVEALISSDTVAGRILRRTPSWRKPSVREPQIE
jgi:hypothetical protein